MSDNTIKRTVKGRRPQFNDDLAMDNAHGMIMALATELAVLHDRMDSMARIAERKGVMLTEEIDAFEPDEATLVAREQWRNALLKRMFYVLREQADDVTRNEDDRKYTEFLQEIA
jgi:hypothetical protein